MSAAMGCSSKRVAPATCSRTHAISAPRTTSPVASDRHRLRGNSSMTRALYGQELKDLRSSVVAMASMVDKAINNAVVALVQRDVSMAQQVVSDDRAINEQRWRTEEQALLVIATQAPMARDLRMIAAVIHIVTDLERMADHAAGIAKIAIQTADQPPLKPLIDIPRMSEIARTMLHDAITAFIEEDQAAARAIVARDDEVDALYDQ